MKRAFSFPIASLFYFTFLSLLVSTSSQAGPRVGNGGGVWICQEKNNDYRWIQLVDLFEGSAEYSLTPFLTSKSNPQDIFKDRIAFIKAGVPVLADILTLDSDQLLSLVHFVPKSSQLSPINDEQIRVRPAPESCIDGILYYGQLANFTYDGRLLVSQAIWDTQQFSPMSRAGLLLHELIYKTLRDRFRDTNSSRARALVALLFSNLSGSEINQRAAALLGQSNQTPQLPPVLMHQFQLTCRGRVDFEASPELGSQISLASSSPGFFSGTLLDISFRVISDPESNYPVGLEILHESTGAKASLDRDALSILFRDSGKASLVLNLTNSQELASLNCWATPPRSGPVF
jgi:hypothetical protein